MIKKLKRKMSSFSYWINSINSMKRFIEIHNQISQLEDVELIRRKVCVIVQPWLMTPAPFFSIATGLLLKRRGSSVDFLIDDMLFGESRALYKIQIWPIIFLGRILSRSSRVLYLSKFSSKQDSGIISENYLDYLVSQNAVHFMKGELKQQGRELYKAKIKKQLVKANPLIKNFFSENSYDFINVSGGIYSTTGLYLAYAKKFKIRATTYDAGFGVLVSSVSGIAAQLSDIPFGVEILKREVDISQLQSVKKFSFDQIEDRKAGTDVFGFLDTGTNIDLLPDEVGVVILLNSVWDSAALGINTIYGGYVEWLVETVKFLLEKTDKKITVRQHPGEKLDYQKPTDDLDNLLMNTFCRSERIQFIDCYAKINTYQLIDHADLVICYSSTTGIESSILGKSVIVASNCYYSNANFVSKPKSLTHYHELILANISKRNNPISSNNLDGAILYYFLGQCCNWVFTNFTPMPDDFKKWVRGYHDLLKNPEVEMYLTSIEEGIPISVLIARTKISQLKIK